MELKISIVHSVHDHEITLIALKLMISRHDQLAV